MKLTVSYAYHSYGWDAAKNLGTTITVHTHTYAHIFHDCNALRRCLHIPTRVFHITIVNYVGVNAKLNKVPMKCSA